MTEVNISIKPGNVSWRTVKKVLLLILILGIAVLDILIYWNSHLYNKATERTEDTFEKIRLLERANRFYSWNDQVYVQLGQAHLELFTRGMSSQEEGDSSQFHLQKAMDSFKRAIELNPAFALSHYGYAQALEFMSFYSDDPPADPFEEYKKAALLAGSFSEIYMSVARKYIERWDRLDDGDKDFITQMIRQSLESDQGDRFLGILTLWDFGIGDYDVIRKMMPDSPGIYRQYADFLARRSLSLEERQRALAKAEGLDFQRARDLHIQAQSAFRTYNLSEAEALFRRILGILHSLRFYQDLLGQQDIDPQEFSDMEKSCWLHIVKSRIESVQPLIESEAEFTAYLDAAESMSEIGEFRTYLENTGQIDDRLVEQFSDWDRMHLQLQLYFRQNAFQDIMRLGRSLQRALIAVPEEKRQRYAGVLRILGDSFQKSGYMYDAEDLYKRALDVNPEDVETLLRLKEVYVRLNDSTQEQRISRRIEGIVSPGSQSVNRLLNVGQEAVLSLPFDGRAVSLRLLFQDPGGGPPPLISVAFNGRIRWEDRLSSREIKLDLEPVSGKNALSITAHNRRIRLLRMDYE